VDAERLSVDEAVRAVREFIEDHRITMLDVAGPRAGGRAEGYVLTLAVMGGVIEHSKGSSLGSAWFFLAGLLRLFRRPVRIAG